MKVNLVFVPPGGGEADYSLEFDLPAIPQPGDYIQIAREGENGSNDFIVRRTWWTLKHTLPKHVMSESGDKPRTAGSVSEITVECEFALGPYSSDSHKSSCEMYKGRKGHVKEFEASAY